MASFENLVALANYEERLREARRIVWRDRGEKPVELDNLWECVEHAGRGAMRAGSLAFAIRSGVNLILLMTRIKRIPKSYRLAMIRHALFGPDSWRFAAMLGSFVGFYKLVLNSLPILLPEPSPPPIPRSLSRSRSRFRAEHRSHLRSSSTHDNALAEDDDDNDEVEFRTEGAHQMWVRKKTRRWYSVVAGAVAGGLAIMCEDPRRRMGIAQQMFVRGLQGSYNAFSDKHGIRIPHGDVIVFSLCCGQILYAFLLRPDTLDRSYVNWINEAAKIPKECVSMNRDLVRDHMFKMSDIDSVLARKDLMPANRTGLLARKALASQATPEFGPFYGPCEAVHPALESCMDVPFDRFYAVFKWMVPIYGALHLIPMLLFKRKVFVREPLKMLLRSLWGTARSSAFLGAFVVIYQCQS
ncbi:hypothetical protein NM688_g8677 [Phlebia brevispora]|uniref:Uncharacterized protein n=1 Tax=Phlebia brevispora TaxID=194682 RepID=A0ACC1RRS5_9APHY|nr:hypothetical protein NM688_g8677 [Phlebia brevispora]